MEITEELQLRVDRYIHELFDDTGLRAEWKEYIYKTILKPDKPTSVKDICEQLKDEYPDCCDDTLPCLHKGILYSKKGEWRHQVRNCLESLVQSKKAKIVERGYYLKL